MTSRVGFCGFMFDLLQTSLEWVVIYINKIQLMLKSFDFFRKIQTDQELTSTTGGVFTIIALIVTSH